MPVPRGAALVVLLVLAATGVGGEAAAGAGSAGAARSAALALAAALPTVSSWDNAKDEPIAAASHAAAAPRAPSRTEVLGLAIVCLFASQFAKGRKKNAELAAAYARALAPVLARHFALVGPKGRAEGAPPGPLLVRDSAHEYHLWASGRRGVAVGCLCALRLVPRQDALSLVAALFDAERDVVEVSIPLPEGLPPVALAAGRKGAVDAARDADPALDALAKPLPTPRGSWPAILVAAGDSEAAFADIVARGPLGRALAAAGPRLRCLRLVSDGALKAPRALKVTIDLPGIADPAALKAAAALVDAAVATVDALAAHAMPPAALEAAAAARAKAATRQAAAAAGGAVGEGAAERRRREKREAEKARLAGMTLSEREKYLAKRAKVEQRRGMKRMTVRA